MRFRSFFEAPLPKKKSSLRPLVEQMEDRTVMSVTVGVSVDGMNTTNNSCNCQPPDTIAAAGPFHVVEMVNSAIEVFNKDGTVASAPQSLATFFSPTNANQSDPFVFYDEIAGQFVAGVLDYSSGSAADLVDFATGTDNVTGGITWTIHTPIASAEGSKFLDYPRVGYNADAYFIEGNMFAGNSFTNVQIITINKSGSVLSRHDDSSLFTATPAAMHGSTTGGPEYFLEAANGGASNLQVVTETNVTSTTPSFTTTSVAVPSYRSGGSPNQPGGRTLPSFDDRIFDAAFRNVGGVNHLVAAHQVKGPSHSIPVVARWYDIDMSRMTLIQSGNAPAGASGSSQFMPSVDINTAGSIGMTFDESSKSEFWSMYVTERIASDPSGTMEAPVLAKAGTASSSDSRVGDYSATTVDPADGLTFWSANEYQGSDFWDTHIASFKSSTGTNIHVPITAASAGTNAQSAQTLSAVITQDPPPRTSTPSRSISQPARTSPPTAAPHLPPPPQAPWTTLGTIRRPTGLFPTL